MDDIIKIKCPVDGVVMAVRNQPGIESKNVTCPVCKHTYPFTKFKRVNPQPSNEDPNTEYSGNDDKTSFNGEYTGYGDGDKTKFAQQLNTGLGKVTVIGKNISYQLKPGRNIIGRKGKTSSANFQIDTGNERSMSREHIVIDIKKLPAKGYVHYLSLYKEKVHETFIGNERLFYGDCIVLTHGNTIKLPDATLRFEIPDEDLTEF